MLAPWLAAGQPTLARSLTFSRVALSGSNCVRKKFCVALATSRPSRRPPTAAAATTSASAAARTGTAAAAAAMGQWKWSCIREQAMAMSGTAAAVGVKLLVSTHAAGIYLQPPGPAPPVGGWGFAAAEGALLL